MHIVDKKPKRKRMQQNRGFSESEIVGFPSDKDYSFVMCLFNMFLRLLHIDIYKYSLTIFCHPLNTLNPLSVYRCRQDATNHNQHTAALFIWLSFLIRTVQLSLLTLLSHQSATLLRSKTLLSMETVVALICSSMLCQGPVLRSKISRLASIFRA